VIDADSNDECAAKRIGRCGRRNPTQRRVRIGEVNPSRPLPFRTWPNQPPIPAMLRLLTNVNRNLALHHDPVLVPGPAPFMFYFKINLFLNRTKEVILVLGSW
jgi:hypothetical protein